MNRESSLSRDYHAWLIRNEYRSLTKRQRKRFWRRYRVLATAIHRMIEDGDL